MRHIRFEILCIQLFAAMFFLFALSKPARTQGNADARAVERLKWMRQNEGNLWNINTEEGAFLRDLVLKVHAKEALEIGTSNGYSGIWIGIGLRLEGRTSADFGG